MTDWTKWKYRRKTPEQIDNLVIGIATGDIFTSDHVEAKDVGLLPEIFVCTALMGAADFRRAMQREDIEMFYASITAAGPWKVVDRYPVFLGCGFLNTAEAGQIRERVKAVIGRQLETMDAARERMNREQEEPE